MRPDCSVVQTHDGWAVLCWRCKREVEHVPTEAEATELKEQHWNACPKRLAEVPA